MAHCHFYGRVNRRVVKLKDSGTAHVQVSTQRHPLGSNIDPPEGIGSTSVDHSDEPIGVRMAVWHATGEIGDGVEVHDVDSFAEGTPDAKGRARELGAAQIIAETAVRKKGDGEGSVNTEYRMTLRMEFDSSRPLDQQAIGHFLNNKTFALSLTPAQVSLPAMPPKRKPGRPAKSAQTTIDDAVAAQTEADPDNETGEANMAADSARDAEMDHDAAGNEPFPATDPATVEAREMFQGIKLTDIDTTELVAILEAAGSEQSPYLQAVQEELNRREVEPSMMDRASKTRRKGKKAAE